MKTIGLFNVKAGVGTTTLVYHLAWMYQELGVRVVALDLDPQTDLTAAFLPEEEFGKLVFDGSTVYGLTFPWMLRTGDEPPEPPLVPISENLELLPGDLRLSLFTDLLSEAWWRSAEEESIEARSGAFRLLTAFHQVIQRAARKGNAQLVLMDIGPGLNSISRAALLACDSIIFPLSTRLYSLLALPLLGDALGKWRSGWNVRTGSGSASDLPLPAGELAPMGYVVLQHTARGDQSYWMERIARFFDDNLLKDLPGSGPDSYRLASLKHYRSLMLLAQDARKPMFLLKPADGALGSHAEAVVDCYRDFKQLAIRIASACGIDIPS